jgi:hypothetical protein
MPRYPVDLLDHHRQIFEAGQHWWKPTSFCFSSSVRLLDSRIDALIITSPDECSSKISVGNRVHEASYLRKGTPVTPTSKELFPVDKCLLTTNCGSPI